MAVVCGRAKLDEVKSELEEDLKVKFAFVDENHEFSLE